MTTLKLEFHNCCKKPSLTVRPLTFCEIEGDTLAFNMDLKLYCRNCKTSSTISPLTERLPEEENTIIFSLTALEDNWRKEKEKYNE